jgi:hypothetical protein
MELRVAQRLRKGDVAPQFEFTTLDGQKHQLSEYAAKHLLIVYWTANAAWQDQQVEQINSALRGKWSNDPRLAILWLELGSHLKDISPSATKMNLTGVVGSKFDAMPEGYRPCTTTVTLIGPDGKLLQRFIHDGFVDKILSKHLGKAPPAQN